MFDVSTVSKRYFDITITVEDDEGKSKTQRLQVEPPKVKTLKKIIAMSKDKENEEAMEEAIRLILTKNKDHHKVSDDVIENLDFDQYIAIFNAYEKWLAETRQSDPNS